MKTMYEKERESLEILGLKSGASMTDITKAYYAKALLMHPDKNPDNSRATEDFKQLNEAYTFLKEQNTTDELYQNLITLKNQLSPHFTEMGKDFFGSKIPDGIKRLQEALAPLDKFDRKKNILSYDSNERWETVNAALENVKVILAEKQSSYRGLGKRNDELQFFYQQSYQTFLAPTLNPEEYNKKKNFLEWFATNHTLPKINFFEFFNRRRNNKDKAIIAVQLKILHSSPNIYGVNIIYENLKTSLSPESFEYFQEKYNLLNSQKTAGSNDSPHSSYGKLSKRGIINEPSSTVMAIKIIMGPPPPVPSFDKEKLAKSSTKTPISDTQNTKGDNVSPNPADSYSPIVRGSTP